MFLINLGLQNCNYIFYDFLYISHGFSYILLVVDYVSRLVEAKATRTNDSKVVVDFVRSNIFARLVCL